MRIYPKNHWTGAEVGRLEQGVGLGQDPFRRVALAAAHASEHRSALIFRKIADGYDLVDANENHDDHLPRLAHLASPHAVAVGILDPVGSSTDALWLEHPRHRFRTCAAMSIGGNAACQGLLLIADEEDRAPLSPAQLYVLQAHAAHLATLFAVDDMQNMKVEREADQRAQAERLRLLESVAVHARDSIIITEAEPCTLPGPRILYCNAAFESTTGYSSADVIGKTPRILQGPNSDPVARAKLREALAAWQPIEVQLINYRKDGTEFWVELSIVPVADEQGWFTHWVSVQRDVTERKEAEELAVRVRMAETENKALANEISERKRVEAELLYTAFHDNLTRLRNRAFFMDRLATAFDQRLNATSDCAILFLDLDRFKVVNDSLGHAAGDQLLKEVARRLKQCIRPQDVLARFGGDEFAIMVRSENELTAAVYIAERITDALHDPIVIGHQNVFASCSIGIAHASPEYEKPEELIRDADIAMYAAKRSGFGDYAVFAPHMREEAAAILALDTDLRIAIEQRQFRLEYQPIVRPLDGRVQGFEALIRWDHPVRGTLMPDAFISVAEDVGLIRQIDRWVMREALFQLSMWHRSTGNNALRLSLNVSAVEFTDPHFLPELIQALEDHNVMPHLLELEITEGIFLHPTPRIATILEEIRRLGVRIALDDFGTGYSALSYINKYPIDTIKIDKSFIADMCDRPTTMAVIRAIVTLATELNLSIVAEGVETSTQVEILNTMSCSYAQGFFFSPPISATLAEQLVRQDAK